jgi:hypothetical protein
MKIRLALAALVAAIGTALVVTPGAFAQAPTQAVTLNTACTLSTGGGCTVQLTGFEVVNGQLAAVVQIVNTATGDVIATLTQVLQTPTGTCQILHLVIGPIDLNLLGLMVHTNQIVLDITAQAGPGNLLGNLLCAVAHLLDNPSAQLNGVAGLLNNLLRHGLLV